MDLIPHPFTLSGYSKDGSTTKTETWDDKVIMLIDPMSILTCRLDEMLNNGEGVLSLFHDGYLKIDNVDITNRKRPAGVQVYQARWKNSK